jgi:hypothetical protein
VAPFDVLAQRFNGFLESGLQSTAFTKYVDVNSVFQACQKEIPENSQFYLAAENCLDTKVWQDEEGNKLDDDASQSNDHASIAPAAPRQESYGLPLHLTTHVTSFVMEELNKALHRTSDGIVARPLELRPKASCRISRPYQTHRCTPDHPTRSGFYVHSL